MIRMLIVDDEPIIADGLYDEFAEHSSLDLDVYRVYSGREALKLLDRTKIDIVISDIKMPGIDGLQLLEQIRRSWPECKVIFLTGYKEFDFAYRAIEHGVVKYVLKTEGYVKVVEAVEAVVREIEESLKASHLIEQAKRQINEAANVLQKQMLAAVQRGELDMDPDMLREELCRSGIRLLAGRPVLIAEGRFDAIPLTLPSRDKATCRHTLNLIAEKYLSPLIESAHFVDDRGNVFWLMQPKISNDHVPAAAEPAEFAYEAEDEFGRLAPGQDRADRIIAVDWDKHVLFIKDTLETIQSACRETLQYTVSFAFHTKPAQWEQIAETCGMLDLLLDYRIGAGTEMLLTDLSAGNGWPYPSRPDKLAYQVHDHQYAELEHYLEKGQRDSFFGLLRNITQILTDDTGRHYPPAQEIYYSVSLLFLTYINRWNWIDNMSLMTEVNKLFKTDGNSTWTESIRIVEKVASLLFDLQEDECVRRTDDTIAKLKEYVAGHIQEDLSLVKLAELVFFNPSYLSRLFKQSTGMNLSEYIQEAKVARAMELLRRNDMKINDVSEALGFGSPSNFARSFKKTTRMSPQEFRDSLHR